MLVTLKPKNGYKKFNRSGSLEAIFGAVCLDGGGNRALRLLYLYKTVLLKDISLQQIDLGSRRVQS